MPGPPHELKTPALSPTRVPGLAVMLIRDDLPRDHRLKLRNGPSLGRVCHEVVMLLVSRHAYWG